jgi:hypothetical protein
MFLPYEIGSTCFSRYPAEQELALLKGIDTYGFRPPRDALAELAQQTGLTLEQVWIPFPPPPPTCLLRPNYLFWFFFCLRLGPEILRQSTTACPIEAWQCSSSSARFGSNQRAVQARVVAMRGSFSFGCFFFLDVGDQLSLFQVVFFVFLVMGRG